MLKQIDKWFGAYRRVSPREKERLKKQVEDHYRWLFEMLTMNWDQYLYFERLKKADLEHVERTGELRITALNR